MQFLKYPGMKYSWFKKFTVGIALFFTFLLFLSIGTLLFVLSPSEIFSALLSEEMLYSMKLSVLTSSISTFSVMCCSIPTAYALSRFSFPGKSIIKTVLGLPMAFPELVMGLALLLLFGQSFLGPVLEAVGIKVTFSKLGIIIAQFFVAFPYAVRIIYSTFEDINPRYELVSRSFGYGEFETFRHVTLPMAKSGLFASGVITFARCIGAFGAVLVLAGGSYMYTEVLPVTLYLNISYGNLEMAITSGILLMGIAFLAILSFERFEGGRL
ncbi:Tungstate ABC transporter, permease protein WtpB [Methanosarcina barkeri str. Wiesmoor]|jgi:molybdate transport system permease protein|uniref:Tungstate ABC transporter, permease protein WtpB n=2 Tax=Methanosarcina barkeri TaxID=2208 RepID=A0A0E3QQ39_METBA|nr:ABC transporter permease [Methanosarcina barkeri]AKB52672.1 Tungstate ABC transporter, permease protein WtpB [Methanosarcina barkeri str. Wiesmoor]